MSSNIKGIKLNELFAKKNRKFLIVLLAVLVLIIAITVPTVKKINRDRFNNNLSKHLAAEESNEPKPVNTATPADYYVNGFKYAVDVIIGSNGFTPSALSVKPNTKLIFKTNDTKPHFILLAPGSESPKFFGEKSDITRNQLYQTRLEMPGVYGFYDKYNPKQSLTVTVTK